MTVDLHLHAAWRPPGECARCDLEREEALPVTCDTCPARSEAGWGDSPLCLACQTRADPRLVCAEHALTRATLDEGCPACKAAAP